MKEANDIRLINEAMVRVAKMYAKRFGYIEVEDRVVNVIKEDKFWGNLAVASWYVHKHDYKEAFTYHKVKYLQPVIDEDVPKDKRAARIEIDLHFGVPRLEIFYPSYLQTGEMVNLVYDPDTFVLQSSQVWGKDGFDLAIPLKTTLDETIAELRK